MNALEARTRAIVVHPILPGEVRDPRLRLVEASGLAEALDLDVAEAVSTPLRETVPSTLFGSGKVAHIGEQRAALEAGVIVVDAALTPVQQRNLEKAWSAKVLDRTGMILEIFGLRARTKEGRLQVELARLNYEKSRLVRTWTHLERQRGGRGVMSGPGETQLEADRRMVSEKMGRLKRELVEVRRTRTLHRAQRKKVPFPMIALVGYTNAGKSTLFNTLTKAGVFAKDMPFATLDPTLRGVRLPSGARAMLADTVGFISDLPTDLVEAFRATLEEVQEADVLLHVRDIAHPETDGQKDDVLAVLDQLRAGPRAGQRLIEVWNKIDRLEPDDRALAVMRARASLDGETPAIAVSAVTGVGVADLVARLDDAVTDGAELWRVTLAPTEGKALAWLHAHGEVLSEGTDAEGVTRATVRLSALAAGRYARAFGLLEPVVPDLDDPARAAWEP